MKGALEGVKIADFTWAIAGPMATKHLADYGATVVRVESPKRPGVLRTSTPFKDEKPGVDRAGYFAYLNTNKYSLALDLNHPKAMEIVKKLVSWADVVTENFTPGTFEKWGLSYKELKKLKPDIIMLRTSNQGQTGPYARQPGLGNHLNALTGIIHLTGWPDQRPTSMIPAYTDYFTPNFSALAVIAALDYRRRTGKGQLLDISQFEAGLQFLMPVLLNQVVNDRGDARIGNACSYAAPHSAYRCRGDNRWCAIAVFTDEEWEAFCKVIGNPAWTDDPKFTTFRSRKENEEELNKLVEGWTINFTAEQVMNMMQAAGVSAGVVQSTVDIYHDPQLRHRDFFWIINHKELDAFTHQGQASKLPKTPAEPRLPAPCLGEHTEYVCKEFLGLSQEEFDELLVDGVFI